MKLERRRRLSIDEFVEEYLIKNKPVVVTDAMDTWRAKDLWTVDYLEREFGVEKVQIYNDLFTLISVKTLGEYLRTYFRQDPDQETSRRPSYVRWYTRLKETDDVPWADNVLQKLKDDWSLPYFLPSNSYLLPYCSPNQSINPNSAPFPAKGLFISGKRARTRLHFDPWGSDGVLCQLQGHKNFILYSPDQAPYLTNGDKVVDIEKPDLKMFPLFPQAKVTIEDILNPGEVIFVPRGWLHHVETISPSISLTWNFVHMSTWRPFFKYLTSNPPKNEIETINYFLHGIEGRLP